MMFLDHENMGIDTNFITKGVEITILWLFYTFAVMAANYRARIDQRVSISYLYICLIQMHTILYTFHMFLCPKNAAMIQILEMVCEFY